MRFASLGSGSEGNALVVEVGRTRVMLDCGLGLGDTLARLSRLGLGPEDLSGVLVTHEHADHLGSVARLARKYRLPVFLTHGTLNGAGVAALLPGLVHVIDSHAPFPMGDVLAQPYPVPHDAREPVQFVLSDGARRLGVLTDAGCSTPHIEACLSGVDALVLECNHDLEMLMNGPYPTGLKQRVAGRYGHLDNTAAAALLSRLDRSRLQHVVAAHLSRQNNTPELASRALAGAMGCAEGWISVAGQHTGFGWREIV